MPFDLAIAQYALNFVLSQSLEDWHKIELLVQFISNYIRISSISKKEIEVLALVLRIEDYK